MSNIKRKLWELKRDIGSPISGEDAEKLQIDSIQEFCREFLKREPHWSNTGKRMNPLLKELGIEL